MNGTLTGRAKSSLVRDKIVNHVMIVVDASGSMITQASSVKIQLDQLHADLKESSAELDQETRLTLYSFSSTVQCLAFDTDVLRLPSLGGLYDVGREMTALNDATAIAIDDMLTTSTLYGDHAFLAYVITDGLENASNFVSQDGSDVRARIQALDHRWTVASFVPSPSARRMAEAMGFPRDNIALWAVNSRTGFDDASKIMRSATRGYMTARASGTTSTRSLFSTGEQALNTQTVTAALEPLAPGKYTMLRNSTPETHEMKAFVEYNGLKYRHGTHYYQLGSSRALIQPTKNIVVVNKKTLQAFSDEAPGSPKVRDLIGLSNGDRVSVSAEANREFFVFVQSTATNRHIKTGLHAFTLDPVTA
jgi:hypothetical protein